MSTSQKLKSSARKILIRAMCYFTLRIPPNPYHTPVSPHTSPDLKPAPLPLTALSTEHTQPTTVARISPSGFYCASGDISGTVRIWDIAGTDQTLKLETKAIGGRVNDLAWDGESKRMIAVGDGRERFGSAFFVDGGSR